MGSEPGARPTCLGGGRRAPMNYIADYRKKQRTLAKREENLRRLVARQASVERLWEGAEEIRAARVRARKATIDAAKQWLKEILSRAE